MTREDFIKVYAKNSGVSDRWAPLGMIEITPDWKLIALPCDCGEECCEGWAMLSLEHVLHHLQFHAPEELRSAYIKVCSSRDKK